MKNEQKEVEQKKSSKSREQKRDRFGALYASLKKKSKQSKAWAVVIKTGFVLAMMLWVTLSIFSAQIVASLVFSLFFNMIGNPEGVNSNVTQSVFTAVVYALSLLLIIFVPWKLMKFKTTRDEVGLRGLPTWTDILLSIAGIIVSLILAMILTALMASIFKNIEWNEEQDVGFNNLINNRDFIVAFLSLVVVAPIVEEIIFRGWLYGKLRARIPALPAILAVSALFGFVHLQWNVGVTVFAMSIVMCAVRELTGTIWGGILIHILKNGVAFYFLFVNPIMIQ